MTANSTSFKEGNTASVGNKGGRPRTYDRDYIHEQLDLWSQKPDSIILPQFSAEFSIPSDTVLEFAREDPEFRRTLTIARSRLAARREVMLHQNALHQASYNKYQVHYDTYLKHDEREEKEHTAEVQARVDSKQDTSFNFKVNFGNPEPVLPETVSEKSP